IETASLSTARVPYGVMAHPSAPQFSSSQAVIRACCRPRPSGGTAMRMRTGKRRSAPVISSRGLLGIVFLVCSKARLHDRVAVSSAWPEDPLPYTSPEIDFTGASWGDALLDRQKRWSKRYNFPSVNYLTMLDRSQNYYTESWRTQRILERAIKMNRTYTLNAERLGEVEDRPVKHEHPLSPDALARRDDVPATEQAPQEVRTGLAHARVTVTIPSDTLALTDDGRHDQHKSGGSELLLPERSFLGIKVRDSQLHERGSLVIPNGPQKPHRPAWQCLQHCPRPSGVDRTLLRRINGRMVVPTDSGRVYGEYPARMPFYPSGYPWGCIGRLFV